MSENQLFETVLASTVHDMKNSLSFVMSQLDQIGYNLEHDKENQKAVAMLKYESNRINVSLMQLLTLYKLEKDQLSIQIDEVQVIDFIEDCVATHKHIATDSGVQIEIDCDESLVWFFDPNIVNIAINNILSNSIRYSQSKVLITVKKEDGYHVIQIDDDGQGYPNELLQQSGQMLNQVNHVTGSTRLGLFFCDTIAKAHQRNNRQGKIELDNEKLLAGGCFRLFLP